MTLLLILAFSVTATIACVLENRRPAKDEQDAMGKRNLLKCMLLTASFFVVFYLWKYYEFVIESDGSFWEFVKTADYSLLFFLSVLALFTYAFKMGFSNFFGDPDKTEEEKLLPDQGAENVVPGYIEDYVVCENCQKASVDSNATLTQCPMCKAQFERGKLIAKT